MMICLWSRSTAATPDLWVSICPHKHLTLIDWCRHANTQQTQTLWSNLKCSFSGKLHLFYIYHRHSVKLSAEEGTHTPLDLVFNGFNDTSVFTLTQSLCSFEILKSHLHFLLFKRHHCILQKGNRWITLLNLHTAIPQWMLWSTGLKRGAKSLIRDRMEIANVLWAGIW